MRLAVIPARGGSKGIPGKNLKTVCGKPLIAWSVESARESQLIDQFVVSTDSDAIADVAREWGAEVLLRPPELATDQATTISVLQHLSNQITDAGTFIVLQPTSPVRDTELIDDCIREYMSGDYDTLATGYWCKYREYASHNNTRRQDYKGFFYDDGNVYILDRRLVVKGQWYGERICRKVIARHQNFEIDDEIDLEIVSALLHRYKESN